MAVIDLRVPQKNSCQNLQGYTSILSAFLLQLDVYIARKWREGT
jgi:predicted transporter